MADSNVFLPFPRGTTAAGGPINPVPGTATAPTTAVYGTGIAESGSNSAMDIRTMIRILIMY